MAIESIRMIDIDQFVPEKEIGDLYLGNPYYVVSDGEVGAQAFAVIREAIKQEGMVALGRVAAAFDVFSYDVFTRQIESLGHLHSIYAFGSEPLLH